MKRRVNISLISLYVIENNGTRFISASLRKDGYKVTEIYFKDWINNRFIPPKEIELHNLIEVLRKAKTDLVGISVRASAYHEVATLITERIREALKIPIIWGGLHITSLPEECIKIADIVCIGEGQYPMLDLMERLSNEKEINDIRNLWVRTSGEVIKNEIRPLVQNLDELPFRDFHSRDKYFIESHKVTRGDPYVKAPLYQITASSGCPFSTCSFCGNSILKNIFANKGCYYRQRSPKNVIQELLYAKKYFKHLRMVRFDDGVFIPDIEWVNEFCREYQKKIKIPFSCMVDPRTVNREWLTKLKKAGLTEVYMGIQNTERINRELYNRPISNQQVLKAARMIHDLRINCSYHLVLDDPLSTRDDKRELFELTMSLPRPFNIYLFSMTIFPKSLLAEKLLKKKLITENDIEGKAHKVFEQWRVDLNYPRPKEDIFWTSLIILVSKNFIPKVFLHKLAKSKFLFTHPKPLAFLAQVSNMLKMLRILFGMILKRKINLILLQRWTANIKSLVSA